MPQLSKIQRLRRQVYRLLEAADGRQDRFSRNVDLFLMTLIVLNVFAVVLESVPSIRATHSDEFFGFEVFSVVIFSAEYIGRLWSCTVEEKLRHPLRGRVRFAFRPMSIIDLLAVLPFYLQVLGVDLRVVRALRLFRLIRILKLSRYSKAMRLIGKVLVERSDELTLTTVAMLLSLIVAASLMYFVEHDAQPEAFSSIPATVWWAVVTLTTVGYGDVTPVTMAGKLVGGAIAILGVGMVALPAGIISSGFVEAINERRNPPSCPHCGKEIHADADHEPVAGSARDTE